MSVSQLQLLLIPITNKTDPCLNKVANPCDVDR